MAGDSDGDSAVFTIGVGSSRYPICNELCFEKASHLSLIVALAYAQGFQKTVLKVMLAEVSVSFV